MDTENTDFEKKLNGLPKANNFKVPEGYFEQLPYEIQGKIHASRELKPRFNLLRPSFSLPILACMILLAVGIHFYQVSEDKIIGKSEQLADNEILNQIDEQILIDEYDQLLIKDKKADPVIDYLIEDNIDPAKELDNEDI